MDHTNLRTMELKTATKVILWFFIWTTVGFIQAGRQYYYYNCDVFIIPWMQLSVWAFGESFMWGLISIFYYKMSDYFNFEKKKLFMTLSFLLISIPLTVYIFIHAFSVFWFYTKGLYEHSVGQSLTTVGLAIDSMFEYRLYISTVICLAIVFISYAVRFYNRYRSEENRLVRLQAKLAKAQLGSLKSQLHPHFLFNTLNSITALIHENPYKADKMTTLLSDLLRSSFENSESQEVPLRTEMEFLDKYLEIQKIRFEDQLEINKKVSNETLDAFIPNLLLQPLVENALKHGISKLSEKGRLIISAFRSEGNLIMKVQDNGNGISDDKLSGKGLGLKNTFDRLNQLYGTKYNLSYQNLNAGGFEVSITIPFLKEPMLKSNL